jgi:hypothetical protein
MNFLKSQIKIIALFNIQYTLAWENKDLDVGLGVVQRKICVEDVTKCINTFRPVPV